MAYSQVRFSRLYIEILRKLLESMSREVGKRVGRKDKSQNKPSKIILHTYNAIQKEQPTSICKLWSQIQCLNAESYQHDGSSIET